MLILKEPFADTFCFYIMTKKIVITGASGLIGSKLTSELAAKNYQVTIFTRDPYKAKSCVPTAVNYVQWDYHNPGKWQDHFEDTYAVIHLAGASIAGKRFTESYKNKVRNSRIISTRNIVKGIADTKNKPAIFLCASGINYYGDSNDKILMEESSAGNDFLAKVCSEWEYEASRAEDLGLRRVSIRTSPVLSIKEGMLKTLLPLFKFYLGASLGSGRQWFSWIHIDDIVKTYLYALENNSISGPVNASSPNPVKMDEFAKQFGGVLNRPAIFKVPKSVLKAVIGEAADFITASLRVIPAKLLDTGFVFKFPKLHAALVDLASSKR